MNSLNNNAFSAPANNRFEPTKATKVNAESGLNNDQWMTPLRTAQAIAALAGNALGGAFYSAIPPENPSEGQIWTDSNDFTSYQYLEGRWIET
jgi:hypothetical protein